MGLLLFLLALLGDRLLLVLLAVVLRVDVDLDVEVVDRKLSREREPSLLKHLSETTTQPGGSGGVFRNHGRVIAGAFA